MRIDRTRAGSPLKAKRTNKAVKGDSFPVTMPNMMSAPTNTVISAPSISGPGSVNAVMALQQTGDTESINQRAARHGRKLIEALDRLRISILEDDVNTKHLALIRRELDQAREPSSNSELEALIEQIELRVEVELAKLDAASLRNNSKC